MKSVSIAVAIAIVFCAANIAAAGGGAAASAEVAQADDLTGPIWTRLPAPPRGPKEPKEKYRRKKRQRKLWYWTATPPASGAQPIYIGPYPNLWDCRDMLGSALYAHPFACHLDGPNPPSNCRIIGNGFAYPKGYPYPVPSDMMIPSADCVESDDPSLKLKAGWYFLYYTVSGGGVATCNEYKKYKEMAEITPGMELGHYYNMQCPGAPCFSVGFDTACN